MCMARAPLHVQVLPHSIDVEYEDDADGRAPLADNRAIRLGKLRMARALHMTAQLKP